MQNTILRFDRFASLLSRWFNLVGGVGLLGMLGLVIADIIGIKVFSNPIPGAIEIVAFLGVVVTSFAIAHTYVLRGHIQVEFFVMRLPVRARHVVTTFVSVLGIILFILLAWRSFAYGRVLQSTGEVSMTRGIPFYPFVYMIALCCVPVCLVLLAGLLKSVSRAVKE
jgi:TRAP-type C4-dicarboxylate transport system permease small subunit